MIGSDDILNVAAGMVPLYVALALGYGSVKWWRLFNAEQCDGINRFICLFILPLFSFDFTAHVDPFLMNYRLIGADAMSKIITILALAVWAKFGHGPAAEISWCMTAFSLCTLTNLLVVGVPVMTPMYDATGVDLVVQLSVVQSLIWFPLLLLFLEYRKARMESTLVAPAPGNGLDVEGGNTAADQTNEAGIVRNAEERNGNSGRDRSFSWGFMRVVGVKLAMNPNVIAVVLGVAWALSAHWLNIKMPSVMHASVQILSRAGTGTAMFNIGIFIAMQKRIIACGKGPTALGMVLRFIVGPAAMAMCSYIVGLRGLNLRIAIIQAALPQSIASFVYAKEYGLHANVISTAVVFGTLVSLPLLIGYYVVLQSAVV